MGSPRSMSSEPSSGFYITMLMVGMIFIANASIAAGRRRIVIDAGAGSLLWLVGQFILGAGLCGVAIYGLVSGDAWRG